MQKFMSEAEVASANLPPPVRRTVLRAVTILHKAYGKNYQPEDDGYVVLVDPADMEETIVTELGHSLSCLPWEGGYRDGENLVGVLLRNNQFGLTVVVPLDAHAVLRQHLRESLRREEGGR